MRIDKKTPGRSIRKNIISNEKLPAVFYRRENYTDFIVIEFVQEDGTRYEIIGLIAEWNRLQEYIDKCIKDISP